MPTNVNQKGLPYYSQGMFFGNVAANVLTVPAQVISLFNYGINDPLVASGFPAAWGPATYSETNLQQARSTNGDSFRIFGIQAKFTQDSEAAILEQLYDNSDVTLETEGGTRVVHLGPLGGIPGGNTLNGSGHTRLQPSIGSAESFINFASSGAAGKDAMLKIPNGFLWSKGNSAMSQLTARIALTRAVTIAVPATRSATATNDAYTQPAVGGVDRGTYVRIAVRLIGLSTP